MVQLTREELQSWRDAKYRRLTHLRVRSEDEALAFLNDVGLANLFSAADMELPSLWEAICGGSRSIPEHHNDYELGLTWDWKDTLPARKAILYGKFLRKKPVFIALDLAPHFYALSGNFGELDDYLQEYEEGRLSEEAKRVYEALLAHGALPTSHLRREARLASKDNAPRFDRALAELQMGFKIVKVGISDANRWGYCYVYDVFIRQFPDVVSQSRAISENQAADTILTRYLATVRVATPAQLLRLFGWEPWRLERSLERLARSGVVRTDVRVGDEGGFVGLASLLP
ncbi:MAG: crosslink repair DNA glycosylase YcaQ family protein [Anaerolineae bacterium]|nr:crosslink repair DNA glycosylase YcaQ family protein [Anaerolineae bacterium]